MSNALDRLKKLLPGPPLLVGDVAFVDGNRVTVSMIGGGQIFCIGTASVGQRVFFRDGVILGEAPNLPFETIEV